MNWPKTPDKGGIYIHLPFCRKKCTYCDFYSITDLSLQEPFYKALCREIQLRGDRTFQADTLYFGGGTPSLFSPRMLDGIIQTIFAQFSLSADSEITIEINPGTVTREGLIEYRRLGINRINIGVQSFHTEMLRFLGRIHNADDARSAVRHAREARFENLGLDLIYAIPRQSLDAWQANLKQALNLSPEHLSCYMLTYEKETPLEKALRRNLFKPIGDQLIAEMFTLTVEMTAGHGFEHYEISNFAKLANTGQQMQKMPDRRSRHNQKYWTWRPYLGFGPAAHSFDLQNRYWNFRHVGNYIDRLHRNELPVEARETLTVEQQMIEHLYLGLRCSEGIQIKNIEERFNLNFMDTFGRLVGEYAKNGLLLIDERSCRLTCRGMLLADRIVSELIDFL